ncbi:unnamed protein product, partial [Prorocentrum cordatum]
SGVSPAAAAGRQGRVGGGAVRHGGRGGEVAGHSRLQGVRHAEGLPARREAAALRVAGRLQVQREGGAASPRGTLRRRVPGPQRHEGVPDWNRLHLRHGPRRLPREPARVRQDHLRRG